MATAKKKRTVKKAAVKKFVSPWPKDTDQRVSTITLNTVTDQGKHVAFNVCSIHWQDVDDELAVKLGEAMLDVATKTVGLSCK